MTNVESVKRSYRFNKSNTPERLNKSFGGYLHEQREDIRMKDERRRINYPNSASIFLIFAGDTSDCSVFEYMVTRITAAAVFK